MEYVTIGLCIIAIIAIAVILYRCKKKKATYVVGVHFSKDSKDTLEDKMKRLMRGDVKAANF